MIMPATLRTAMTLSYLGSLAQPSEEARASALFSHMRDVLTRGLAQRFAANADVGNEPLARVSGARPASTKIVKH